MRRTIGHGLASTVFWGQRLARGAETLRKAEFSLALILMDNGYGPQYRTVTTMTENRGAEQNVTLLQPEEILNEHTKSVQGLVRRIDTSLLMGDLFTLFTLASERS